MYVYGPFSQIQSQLHLFLNHNTILLDNFPEAIYKLNSRHVLMFLVWNVVVTQIVYAFQLIEKKVMKGRIKESLSRSRKIVFGTTVS